jgi:hypothetical protein
MLEALRFHRSQGVKNAKRGSYARQHPEIPSAHEIVALKVLVFKSESFYAAQKNEGIQ